MCEFIMQTKDRGYFIKRDGPCSWVWAKDFLYKISGESDADLAKDPISKALTVVAHF